MTQLKVYEAGVWNVLFDTARVGGLLNTRLWIYQAYDAADLHTSADRTFTLVEVPIDGAPTVRGAFHQLDVFARVGRLGANTVSYGGSSSTITVSTPWSTRQFARHAGFLTAPPDGNLTITTDYPMPTTDPSLYAFAIASYSSA